MAAHIRNSTLHELVRPDGIAGVWCDGREILRRIFITVRDHRWAEIGPTQWESSLDEAQGTATLKARHIGVHVAFEWEASLRVSSDSRELRFALTGKALRDMEVCRLGLVILHPVETMAGSRIIAVGPETKQRLTVPDLISPQPIVNGIPAAMTEPFSELLIEREGLGGLTLRFEGDLFELEDQRNWGDASFKTYCTPLRLGFPRRVEAGTLIKHSVEIRFKPATPYVTMPSKEGVGLFPALSRQWPPSSTSVALHKSEPAWHAVHLDVAAQEDLAQLPALLSSVSTNVQVGIGSDVTPTPEVLKSLSMHADRIARVILYGPNVSPHSSNAADAWRKALHATRSIPIFAGTRGYYVEFNRAKEQDKTACGIAFPLSATVHSDDAATIADNVSAISAMTETARHLTGLSQILVVPLALYYPPSASPQRFPANLVQPWLAAMLLHAAQARIESVTLAADVLEAINLYEPSTLNFVSRMLECVGLEVIPLEAPQTSGLHAAAFRRQGQRADRILAANLSPQSAALSSAQIGLRIAGAINAATGAPLPANEHEVAIPGFGTAWIELA
jgi:D-apionolactonase